MEIMILLSQLNDKKLNLGGENPGFSEQRKNDNNK